MKNRKNIYLLFFALVLLTWNINCGGGSSSSSSKFQEGTTSVTINLGETKTALAKKGVLPCATSTIPQEVVSIRFTISGQDMTRVTRTISTGGRTNISESFTVPNGANRHFLIEAFDAQGKIPYRGDTFANLNGSPVTLNITMISTDKTPPTFNGLNSAIPLSTTSIELSWTAATDNLSPSEKIQYLIYISAVSGGENFSSPNYTTTLGATTFTVTGLNPGTVYYFVVRAMDERGLIDLNLVEKSAKTLSPPDLDKPLFNGLISATAVSSSEINLQWEAAVDNITSSSKIVYLIYISIESGGENFAIPSFTTSPGVTSFPVTNLPPDTTYYFVVRAKDEAGNIDENIVEKSSKTLPPSETVPPIFGGLVSATAVSATQISLSWNAASDNISPPSAITYSIYMATMSGGQNFSSPGSSVTGSTSAIISGLTPNTIYYFVVRAHDEAGNTETNTVEKSATTLLQGDITPPVFAGLVSATALSTTEVNLVWNAATDNITSQSSIVYLIFIATTSGAQNFSSPNYVTSPGATSFTVPGLNSNTTYYFIVKAMDLAGNIDVNTIQKSATTLSALVWAKDFGSNAGSERANCMVPTPDGGHIIFGETSSFGAGGSDMWVLKLSSTGDVLWQKTYGETDFDEGNSIRSTFGGGYIVAGNTYSFGAGSNDIWILNLNSSGDIQWQKTLGYSNFDTCNALQTTSDGGYIIA